MPRQKDHKRRSPVVGWYVLTHCNPGYYFAHPGAQYFGVARIGRDQAEDYAKRPFRWSWRRSISGQIWGVEAASSLYSHSPLVPFAV
jgi:hypothetical protein